MKTQQNSYSPKCIGVGTGGRGVRAVSVLLGVHKKLPRGYLKNHP